MHESDIAALAQAYRCIFYDKLAYDHYDYWRKDGILGRSPSQEARQHLRWLRILSAYFDKILIHYNNVFNHPVRHRENMMLHLLCAPDFCEMSRSGTITFVGKGGKSIIDMMRSHRDYVSEFGSPSHQTEFEEALQNSMSVSWSVDLHPDPNLRASIITISSEYLSDRSDERTIIDKYVNTKINIVGNDVRYLPLYRDVGLLEISSEKFSNIAKVLYSADVYSLVKSHPNIAVFHDQDLGAMGELMVSSTRSEDPILAFLFHPDIFISILSIFVGGDQIERLLSLPIRDFEKFLSVEHNEFVQSYHRILQKLTKLCTSEILVGLINNSVNIPNLVRNRIEEQVARQNLGVEAKGLFDMLSGSANIALALHGIPPLASTLIAPFRKRAESHLNLLVRQINEPALIDFARRVRSIRT